MIIGSGVLKLQKNLRHGCRRWRHYYADDIAQRGTVQRATSPNNFEPSLFVINKFFFFFFFFFPTRTRQNFGKVRGVIDAVKISSYLVWS